MNFGSIALVCASSVKTDNAYKILKDIFSHAVSNPHEQAIRLKLKGFGVLKINDGSLGCLELVSLQEDAATHGQADGLETVDENATKAVKA